MIAFLIQITTESLLDEMTSLERLTRPADYACRQFSSYDRAGGFGNNDCGNYLRVEKGEHVLAEADGPGAIVRIWSANPEGTLRIRLDGAIVLEEDFRKLTTGAVAEFPPPFGEETARGCTLYFPFPYAKSMKVTCTKGGQYYHVNYRTYPEGNVETYARRKYALPKIAIEETWTSGELVGPAMITALALEEKPEDGAILKITFDGEPCVSCPVDAFFPGCRTLPIDGLVCRFPMPFAKSAKIEGAKVKVAVARCDDAAKRLRFHAWWSGRKDLKTRPMSDWPALAGEGRGRFVGLALTVRNPVKAWWGEGDEKIYVDGETSPSTCGTGTEDYFGYAWCDPGVFHHPYHAQSRCDGPGNRGFTKVQRFHVVDDIPFEKSIRFDLEVWHWADCEIGFGTVAFWYAEPGFRHAMREGDVDLGTVPDVSRVAGAIEGESMRVLEKTGTAGPQDVSGFGEGWSGETHLWWRDAKPGDALRLGFDAPEAKTKIVLALTKAPDYGIVKISLNGVELGEVDLYDPKVVPAGEREFEAAVKKGANELRIEITGTNAKASPKNHMFGLDYVR